MSLYFCMCVAPTAVAHAEVAVNKSVRLKVIDFVDMDRIG